MFSSSDLERDKRTNRLKKQRTNDLIHWWTDEMMT